MSQQKILSRNYIVGYTTPVADLQFREWMVGKCFTRNKKKFKIDGSAFDSEGNFAVKISHGLNSFIISEDVFFRNEDLSKRVLLKELM